MNSSPRPQPLVLVVDQEQELLDEVTALLTASGYACQCCTTAESAIVSAETSLPDLILSNVNLHGINALDMCRQMQQNPALAEVPLMFLSGSQLPDIIRRNGGGIHGAYYVRLPFDNEVLVELIDTALGEGRV
jgi:CheY-like chemotaxis protein